jgi:mono/diheme cytochrome c family protein
MPKPLLLVLAGTLIAFTPAHNSAQGQSGQQAAPVQAAPTSPAPGIVPTQGVAPAPASYPHNPVKPTAESLTKAKNLYGIDCSMCHGDNGNGKTDLATSMNLTLNDWTKPQSLASYPDGQLFLIIRNGKDKMPSEEKGRASDDVVWNLVYYIRDFSKAAGSSASSAQK